MGLNKTTPLHIGRGCLAESGWHLSLARYSDDDHIHTAAGNSLADGAQGDRFAITGSDIVAEGGAQKVLVGAGQDETFLLSLEVHDGLDLFLAGARVNGLELDAVHGGGYGLTWGQVGGFEIGVKV